MRTLIPGLALLMLCASGAACTLVSRHAAAPRLAQSLQELLPHADGDHFVYVWERIADGQRLARGIQVEHVTALTTAGEFDIATSENGRAVGRVRLRDDGHTLWLLGEDDLTRGIALSYDPPLPQLQMPLVAGEFRATATGAMSALANSQALGTVSVNQTVTLGSGPAVHTAIGTYRQTVSLRIVRALQLPEAVSELHGEALLVPGIGEIQSEGRASDTPGLRRKLACAIIGGKRVGDCSKLNEQWEDSDAGPANVH